MKVYVVSLVNTQDFSVESLKKTLKNGAKLPAFTGNESKESAKAYAIDRNKSVLPGEVYAVYAIEVKGRKGISRQQKPVDIVGACYITLNEPNIISVEINDTFYDLTIDNFVDVQARKAQAKEELAILDEVIREFEIDEAMRLKEEAAKAAAQEAKRLEEEQKFHAAIKIEEIDEPNKIPAQAKLIEDETAAKEVKLIEAPAKVAQPVPARVEGAVPEDKENAAQEAKRRELEDYFHSYIKIEDIDTVENGTNAEDNDGLGEEELHALDKYRLEEAARLEAQSKAEKAAIDARDAARIAAQDALLALSVAKLAEGKALDCANKAKALLNHEDKYRAYTKVSVALALAKNAADSTQYQANLADKLANAALLAAMEAAGDKTVAEAAQNEAKAARDAANEAKDVAKKAVFHLDTARDAFKQAKDNKEAADKAQAEKDAAIARKKAADGAKAKLATIKKAQNVYLLKVALAFTAGVGVTALAVAFAGLTPVIAGLLLKAGISIPAASLAVEIGLSLAAGFALTTVVSVFASGAKAIFNARTRSQKPQELRDKEDLEQAAEVLDIYRAIVGETATGEEHVEDLKKLGGVLVNTTEVLAYRRFQAKALQEEAQAKAISKQKYDNAKESNLAKAKTMCVPGK